MARQARALPVNGEKLQELRKRRGLEVIDLVARSGAKKRTIERYQSGGNALPGNLRAIAEVLRVEVETLLADYKPPTTEPDALDGLRHDPPTTEGGERDPTAVYVAILEQNTSLAKELGVTQSALQKFFEILKEQDVPPGELDAKLREIAAAHLQFQQRLQAMDPDNAESSRLYAEALAAAERGEYDYTRTLLDEADRIDAEAIEVLEARRNKKLLSRAATSAAKGDSYKTQLRYPEAGECYRQALAFVERIPEGNERELTFYLSLLGVHLQDQGNFIDSKSYHERALTIREKTLGPEHPDTTQSLNNLGMLLQAQGNFVSAKFYHERALAIWEKTLGPEHPDTAQSLNSLGILLAAEYDFTGAKSYYKRALAIWEKVLGPEHLHIAAILNNLGELLRSRCDFAGAKSYHERALAIREKGGGPEHPDTAQSLNNLGMLLRAQGDFTGARSYHERDLAIWEKVLGPEHPDTARSGSLPTLRLRHSIENKEIRVNIDLRRIPRKMLNKPIPQQEEPDAWILSVSMPCSNCQNSV